MTGWTWAAARRRGTSHIQLGTRCQDAFKCGVTTTGTLVAVVCDGAGSASFGGEGASVVARSVFHSALRLAEAGSDTSDDDVFRGWLNEVRDQLKAAAAKRDLRPRDFAATLVCVIANVDEAVVLHVGDGGAVGRLSSGEWQTLTWPAHGEYASTTFFVTDDPEPRLVVERHRQHFEAIVAFTDGLERLVLDFAQIKPHAKFFDSIVAPVASSTSEGRDAKLSEQLGQYLDSDAVNARTDDDKTLIIAVRR